MSLTGPRRLAATTPGPAAADTDLDVLVVGAGQAGLAAGHALAGTGLRFLLVEAAVDVGGAWPSYYDSLTLFSPAGSAALPGLRFPGDPRHYPHRDEVVAYLRTYAAHFGLPVRTGTQVTGIRSDGAVLTATLGGGSSGGSSSVQARAVIAASGAFASPYVPMLPGSDRYTGELLHVADYRDPAAFTGRRVVVVGAGNSAVQVAVELADVAQTTLASRAPVRFRPQRPLGIDIHHWLRWSGLDAAPTGRRLAGVTGVLDTGRYRAALAAGRPDRRPMFTELTATGVRWSDGTEEPVDTVLLATGYRPHLPYLADLSTPQRGAALDADGAPLHRHGVSTTVPGLGYVGLPGQYGFASATLRGVGRDARRVVDRLGRQLAADPSPGTGTGASRDGARPSLSRSDDARPDLVRPDTAHHRSAS